MTAPLQILTLVATFVLALLLGSIFDTGYFQAAIIAKEELGGKPLPQITSVLSQNHRALIYVMMVPWVGLAGLPAFLRLQNYFDETTFLIRFAAFAAVESLLSVFLLVFLVLPFIPYYMLMDMRPNTLAESIVVLGFWIVVAVIVLSILRRALTRSRKTAAEHDGGLKGLQP
jgi:hypothetical protein